MQRMKWSQGPTQISDFACSVLKKRWWPSMLNYFDRKSSNLTDIRQTRIKGIFIQSLHKSSCHSMRSGWSTKKDANTQDLTRNATSLTNLQNRLRLVNNLGPSDKSIPQNSRLHNRGRRNFLMTCETTTAPPSLPWSYQSCAVVMTMKPTNTPLLTPPKTPVSLKAGLALNNAPFCAFWFSKEIL